MGDDDRKIEFGTVERIVFSIIAICMLVTAVAGFVCVLMKP